jgi:hypothetical protein
MGNVNAILGSAVGLASAIALGCGGSDGSVPQGGGAGGLVSAGGTRSTGGVESGGSAGALGGGAGAGGRSPFGPYLASCDYRETTGSLAGRCRDWYGGPNPPNLASSCNDIYMREPCPTEGRVGQCQLEPVLTVVAVYNYYAPTWTAAAAMDDCVGGYRSDNKTWIPADGFGDAGLVAGGPEAGP